MLIDDMLSTVYNIRIFFFFLFLLSGCGLHKKICSCSSFVHSLSFSLSLSLVFASLQTNFDATLNWGGRIVSALTAFLLSVSMRFSLKAKEVSVKMLNTVKADSCFEKRPLSAVRWVVLNPR